MKRGFLPRKDIAYQEFGESPPLEIGKCEAAKCASGRSEVGGRSTPQEERSGEVVKREKESKGVRAAERVSASKGGKNKGGRASKREVSELEKKEEVSGI